MAGWLDSSGSPAFIYGEVTGYYLTFLSSKWNAAGGDPSMDARLESALFWCCRNIGSEAIAPTRSYPEPETHDWRNDFVFSFDLAMILRGLAALPAFHVDSRVRRTGQTLARHLNRFIGQDGSLRSAIRLRNNSGRSPSRWSVEPGPYQIKAAAAILCAPESWVEKSLVSAAHKTIQRWRHTVGSQSLPCDLHPLLYSLEGLVLYSLAYHDASACQAAANVFRRLLGRQELDGGLPSIPNHSGYRRSDVIAQALRIGSILMHLGVIERGYARALDGLAHCLQDFLSPDGGVYFDRPSSDAHLNSWCTMFAAQAFEFYEAWREGKTISTEHFLFLV